MVIKRAYVVVERHREKGKVFKDQEGCHYVKQSVVFGAREFASPLEVMQSIVDGNLKGEFIIQEIITVE